MNIVWLEQAEQVLLQYLGSVEPLLVNRPATYRSIVVSNLSKIVYRVKDDIIEIADLWDCRREPQTLANQVK